MGYRTLSVGLVALLPVLMLLPWERIARGNPTLMAARREPSAEPACAGAPSTSGKGTRGWTIPTAIRTPEFWLLVQCFFFTACSTCSVVVQTVSFLVDEGYPPLEAAFAFGASGMLSIVGALGSGWLAAQGVPLHGHPVLYRDAHRHPRAGWFSFAPFGALVLIYVLAFGVSQGARGPVISTLLTCIFARGQVGAIFMTMSFGSAPGTWISGFLQDVTGGYRTAFLFSAISVVGAVSPFWYSSRLRSPGPLPRPLCAANT